MYLTQRGSRIATFSSVSHPGCLLSSFIIKCYFKSGLWLFVLQDRPRTFDMHSLESSLIDIMRAENDSIKGNF